jgi:hypothetical protein
MGARPSSLLAALVVGMAFVPAALAELPEGNPVLDLSPPRLGSEPVLLERNEPAGFQGSEREPLKFDSRTEGFWGTLSGKQVLQQPDATAAWEDPTGKRTWQSEQAWRLPVAGPVAVFGEFGASSEDRALQDMKVVGRTGVACTLPDLLGTEWQVRGGPNMTAADPLRPERTQTHSEMLVEFQGRVPLLAGIGLEYQGSAVPALTPLDRDRIQHDVGLAFPVGDAGKLKFGAKHTWVNTTDSRPIPDATQLYLGLELKR